MVECVSKQKTDRIPFQQRERVDVLDSLRHGKHYLYDIIKTI